VMTEILWDEDFGFELETGHKTGEYIPLDRPRILDGLVVQLRYASEPPANAILQGGRVLRQGIISLGDSDPTTVQSLYTSLSGMEPAEQDLADRLGPLAGRRYPLTNMSVLFSAFLDSGLSPDGTQWVRD